MAAALLGALFLQWPLGWLTDRRARRTVIAAAAAAAALAGGGLALVEEARLPLLLLLSFLFGGFGIPLYTLCLAQANDRLNSGEILAAARSLLLLNGLGARSEEHTSELQSLMRISYAVFCLKQNTSTTPDSITLHQNTSISHCTIAISYA